MIKLVLNESVTRRLFR